jgi:hypothetical protein
MQRFDIQPVQGVKSHLQKRCDGAVFMSSVAWIGAPHLRRPTSLVSRKRLAAGFLSLSTADESEQTDLQGHHTGLFWTPALAPGELLLIRFYLNNGARLR